MNTSFAGSRPEAQSSGLEQVELLHALAKMTELPLADWVNTLPSLAKESSEQVLGRQESLTRIANRLLELDDPTPRSEDETSREIEIRQTVARHAAALHRRVLAEPAVIETADAVFGPLQVTAQSIARSRRELAGVRAA